jgi:hypothetical protein
MRRRFAIWFILATTLIEVRYLGGRRLFMHPRLAIQHWLVV